jgi:hypothetical protein
MTPTLSGLAEPNTSISIRLSQNSTTVQADSQGQWEFTVPPSWDLRRGPQVLIVTDGLGDTRTIEWETACTDGQIFNGQGQCFKDEYIVQGSGTQNLRVCGTLGQGGKPMNQQQRMWISLMLLFLIPLILPLLKRFRRATIIAFLLATHDPSAQGINIQIFKPVLDSNGLIGVTGSEPLEAGKCWLGAYGNKDVRPVELATPLGVRVSDVVSQLYTLDLTPACGLGSGFTAAFNVPFHWIKASEQAASSGSTQYQNYGDMDLSISYNIRKIEKKNDFGVAVSSYVTRPNRKKIDILGTELIMLGESQYTGGIELITDALVGGSHYLAGNLTYHHRPREDFLNIRLEPEWRLGTGYSYLLHQASDTQLAMEWHRREPIGRLRKDRFTSPTELYTGMSSRALGEDARFFGGVSAGLSTGYGAPEYRLYGGVEVALALPEITPEVTQESQDPASIDVTVKDSFGQLLVADRLSISPLDHPDQTLTRHSTSSENLGPLKVGSHELLVDKSGYKSQRVLITIKNPWERTSVPVILKPLLGDFFVLLKTPEDAIPYTLSFRLEENMKPMEATFQHKFTKFSNIPLGSHSITLINPDKKESLKHDFFVVSEGATLIVFDLKKDQAAIMRQLLNVGGIYFDTNKTELKPESINRLNHAVHLLKNHVVLNQVHIEGYTDTKGDMGYNLKLSERRAGAVYQYLVDQGIKPDRLNVKWFGPESPAASNDTAQGRSSNRRVEIVVGSIKNTP